MTYRPRLHRLRSLQHKFLAIHVPLVLIFGGLALAGFEFIAHRAAEQALMTKLDRVVESQANVAREPLWQLDVERLELIARAIVADEDIAHVAFLDEGGDKLVSVGPREKNARTFASRKREIIRLDPAGRAETIGAIRVEVIDARLGAESEQRLTWGIAFTFILLSATVLGGMLTNRWIIGAPLARLLRAIDDSERTHSPQLVDWHTDDEIGRVVRAFNRLQASQEAFRADLRAARAVLEQTVEDRSQQLVAATSERERAEQQARIFAEAMADLDEGFAYFDKDEILIFCNEAYRRLRPNVRDRLIPGARMEDLVRADVASGSIIDAQGREEEYIAERIQSFRNPGEPFIRRLTDGTCYMISENRTADGGIFSTSVDITELKQAEQALRRSEERFRRIFEDSATGIVVVDATRNGKIVQVNAAVCRMVGYEEGELIGKTTIDITHPDDIGSTQKRRNEQEVDRDAVVPFEKRYIHKDGHVIWVRGTSSVIKGGEGEPLHLLGLFQDVTEFKRAEDAVAESEERFRHVFEGSALGILLTEPAGIGRIIEVNPAMCEMLGYADSELVGRPTDKLTHPDDRTDSLQRREEQVLSEEGRTTFSKRYIHKDGRVVWVRGTASVIKGADGMPRYILGVFEDYTEQKKIADALRESEERFRDFAEVASDWFWEMDENLRFSYFSGRNLRIIGFDADELIGKNRAEATTEDTTQPHWQAHLADIAAHRPFEDFRYRITTKGGRSIQASISGKPVFDAEGRFKGFRGTGTDITARVEAEAAARASDLLLQRAIENMQEGFAVFDAGDRLVVCNEEYRNLRPLVAELLKPGVDFETLLRENVERGGIRGAEGREKEYIAERLAKHREPDEPLILEMADDTWKIIKESRLPDGGTAVTETDITDIKRMEQMKSEFIATVSHELRTPLTSIYGSLDLMAAGVVGKLPEEAERLVRVAANNSKRLINLVNDILDLEKLESGRMEFDFEVVDVAQVVNDAIEANQAYAEEYKTTFTLEHADNGATVLGDKDRLGQVMANLMSNAAKFSPPGEPVAISVDRGNGRVRIAVADKGPGIPDEFHPRLFERFSQADGSDTRQVGGTGLGLNITKAIVDKHGGAISFDSAPGSGTTFYVDIPVWQEQ